MAWWSRGFGLLLFAMIVVSARELSRHAHVLILGLLALAPLGGAQVLANTQSAFVLGAFSLGLLAAGREIVVHRRGSLPLMALVALLPAAGAIFRPTTLPFNLPVAIGIAAFAAVYVQGALRRLLVLVPAVSVLYSLSAWSYADVFGTWLYPLLGRGTHNRRGLFDPRHGRGGGHLGNLLAHPLSDPLFLAILGAQAMVLISGPGRAEALFVGAAFAMHVAFTALVLYVTVGLARFAFPVGLAVFTLQLMVLGTRALSCCWPDS